MAGFLNLLLVDVVMGLAAFAAGIFPLKADIALQHMNLASALSMGILVGTALAAIIPEGVQLLIEATTDKPPMLLLGSIIGLALISGFIIMFLVDHYAELTNSEQTLPTASQTDETSIIESVLRSPLTIGLLLHTLVDGIALGAAFANDNSTFQVLFLFMITIHKLPTAFSLSVVLHQEGFPEKLTKIHLALFSAGTPTSLLLTYLVVSLLRLEGNFVVGILFLFSAGTFVYSVIHVMMELLTKPEYSQVNSTYHLNSTLAHKHSATLSRNELLLSILGMSIPVIFTFIGGD